MLQRVLKRFVKNLAVSVLSITVFFGIFELSLRVTGFNEPMKDKNELKALFMMGAPLKPVDPVLFGPYDRDRLLFWKLRPRPSDDVNRKGYRGPIRDYAKPSGVRRILLLGDSCAYGSLVPYKDTYAALLEAKLNSVHQGGFEVINGAVPGYSSLQGLRYLRQEMIRYHPDLVLVGFGFNDLCAAVGMSDKNVPTHQCSAWLIQLDNIVSRMRVYVFMRWFVSSLKELAGPCADNGNKGAAPVLTSKDAELVTNIPDLIKVQTQALMGIPPRRVPPEDFLANIRAIIELGKDAGSRTVLLTLPSINGCFGYGPLLRLIARDEKVELIDLKAVFEKTKADVQENFLDNNHYSDQGHRLVSDIIFSALYVPLFAKGSQT